MRNFSRIVIAFLMVITVISFTYQTSFGAQKVTIESKLNTQITEERVVYAAAAGAVVGVVGAFYYAGTIIGRAVGHYVHGANEEVTLAEVSVHNPADFSSFDN